MVLYFCVTKLLGGSISIEIGWEWVQVPVAKQEIGKWAGSTTTLVGNTDHVKYVFYSHLLCPAFRLSCTFVLVLHFCISFILTCFIAFCIYLRFGPVEKAWSRYVQYTASMILMHCNYTAELISESRFTEKPGLLIKFVNHEMRESGFQCEKVSV